MVDALAVIERCCYGPGVTILEPRLPNLVREEIADLEAYLKQLPTELATSAAFLGYQHRLSALREELHETELAVEIAERKG